MRTIETRTGLTKEKFNRVLEPVRPLAEVTKRGPRPLPLDVRLVVLLQWLSFGQTYGQLGLLLGLSERVVQSAIASIWNVVDDALSGEFIPKSPLKYNPTHHFDHFPDATLLTEWQTGCAQGSTVDMGLSCKCVVPQMGDASTLVGLVQGVNMTPDCLRRVGL